MSSGLPFGCSLLIMQNKASSVTVIIPTYNRKDLVLQALSSVYAQTVQVHEIIVVDDGSTDGTQSQLHPHADRIRYIRQTHSGEANSRNRGLREATGIHVAFLDSDDLWEPSFLETTVSYLERYPLLALVGTACMTIPERERRPRTQVPSMQGDLFPCLFQQNFITASAVTARRSCLQHIGFFDETLDQATDYDFWLRVAHAYPIGFLNQPLCRWRRHPGNVSRHELRHRQCVLHVIERNYDATKVPPRLYRRRLSKLLVSLGRAYVRGHQIDEARACLRRAVILSPWRFRSWLYYFSTLVGTGLRKCLPEVSSRG